MKGLVQSVIGIKIPGAEFVELGVERLLCRALLSMPDDGSPVWSRIGALFSHGSGYSMGLARAFGLNPDSTARVTLCGECSSAITTDVRTCPSCGKPVNWRAR